MSVLSTNQLIKHAVKKVGRPLWPEYLADFNGIIRGYGTDSEGHAKDGLAIGLIEKPFETASSMEDHVKEIDEAKQIVSAISDGIYDLHKNFHLSVGDLMPRNLFVNFKDKETIKFIDLEHSIQLKNDEDAVKKISDDVQKYPKLHQHMMYLISEDFRHDLVEEIFNMEEAAPFQPKFYTKYLDAINTWKGENDDTDAKKEANERIRGHLESVGGVCLDYRKLYRMFVWAGVKIPTYHDLWRLKSL